MFPHLYEITQIFLCVCVISLYSCSLPSLFLTVPHCACGIIDKPEWPRCLCSFPRHFVCFNNAFNWQWNGDDGSGKTGKDHGVALYIWISAPGGLW